MKQRKKQIIVLICAVIVVVFAVGLLGFLKDEQDLPTEYKESDREDAIEYDGKEYQYNEHLSNYLFLGIDTTEPVTEYETRGDAGQADAIFLISYDRVKNTVKSISIPRDTMANLHMFSPDGTDLGYAKNHINIQYAFGDGKNESCNLMKEAVQTLLYGVPIQGYCSINMDGIPIATDLVGGVELVVPDDTLEAVNPEFKQGSNVIVTKENAEQFVRYRNTEERQSAIDRMNRQKVFMKAFAESAAERVSQDSNFIVEMYEGLKPYMVTNMGNDVFAKILQAEYDSEQIFQDVPGEKVDGTDFDEYHVNEEELYKLVLQMFYEEVQDD